MSTTAIAPLISSAALDPTTQQQSMKEWIRKFPPWIYPPPEFEPVDQIGYAQINDPNISTAPVIVVSYRVPPNRNGIILEYANNYVGGGFEEGSADIFWQFLRNGQPIKGYQRVLAALGTPTAPTRHPSGFRIFENDLIQIAVVNLAIPFAQQASGGRLAGWVYPKKYDDKSIWV